MLSNNVEKFDRVSNGMLVSPPSFTGPKSALGPRPF